MAFLYPTLKLVNLVYGSLLALLGNSPQSHNLILIEVVDLSTSKKDPRSTTGLYFPTATKVILFPK